MCIWVPVVVLLAADQLPCRVQALDRELLQSFSRGDLRACDLQRIAAAHGRAKDPPLLSLLAGWLPGLVCGVVLQPVPAVVLVVLLGIDQKISGTGAWPANTNRDLERMLRRVGRSGQAAVPKFAAASL